jgi:hypothetical protein
MTPGEKVAAEWEARHDVAARGHHADPAAVQHYLAESRTRQAQRSGAQLSGADRPGAGHQRVPEPSSVPEPHREGPGVAGDEPAPSSRRRRWWLLGRRR